MLRAYYRAKTSEAAEILASDCRATSEFSGEGNDFVVARRTTYRSIFC